MEYQWIIPGLVSFMIVVMLVTAKIRSERDKRKEAESVAWMLSAKIEGLRDGRYRSITVKSPETIGGFYVSRVSLADSDSNPVLIVTRNTIPRFFVTRQGEIVYVDNEPIGLLG